MIVKLNIYLILDTIMELLLILLRVIMVLQVSRIISDSPGGLLKYLEVKFYDVYQCAKMITTIGYR